MPTHLKLALIISWALFKSSFGSMSTTAQLALGCQDLGVVQLELTGGLEPRTSKSLGSRLLR